jgi:hypothetical protein
MRENELFVIHVPVEEIESHHFNKINNELGLLYTDLAECCITVRVNQVVGHHGPYRVLAPHRAHGRDLYPGLFLGRIRDRRHLRFRPLGSLDPAAIFVAASNTERFPRIG